MLGCRGCSAANKIRMPNQPHLKLANILVCQPALGIWLLLIRACLGRLLQRRRCCVQCSLTCRCRNGQVRLLQESPHDTGKLPQGGKHTGA